MAIDSQHCAARLRTVVVQLSRQLRSGMLGEGLSPAKLSVLGQLRRGAAMTPTELAQREGVKLQTLTRLLAELESAGWINRQVHAADARQTMLSISPLGTQRLAAAVKGGELPLSQAIETRLNAEEQAVLLRACALLETLGDAMRDAGPSA